MPIILERTGILLHLIDAGAIDPESPLDSFHLVNRELALYDEKLFQKTQVIVLNKLDLLGADQRAAAFEKALPDHKVHMVSAATGQGIPELIRVLASKLFSENPQG